MTDDRAPGSGTGKRKLFCALRGKRSIPAELLRSPGERPFIWGSTGGSESSSWNSIGTGEHAYDEPELFSLLLCEPVVLGLGDTGGPEAICEGAVLCVVDLSRVLFLCMGRPFAWYPRTRYHVLLPHTACTYLVSVGTWLASGTSTPGTLSLGTPRSLTSFPCYQLSRLAPLPLALASTLPCVYAPPRIPFPSAMRSLHPFSCFYRPTTHPIAHASPCFREAVRG